MIVRSHGGLRPALAAPGEGRIDHAAFRHEGGAVALVEGEVVVGLADRVAEQRGVPVELADELLRIGIEQQLVRVEAVPVRRLVGAVHAIAIDRARPRVRQVAVPDLVGVFGQLDRARARVLPSLSNRHSSTLVAWAENRAKLTPRPSQVAPSG